MLASGAGTDPHRRPVLEDAMRKMKSRSITGLAVLLTAGLSASAAAYAETTTEIRVVNNFSYTDENGVEFNVDSGWLVDNYRTGGSVEIGSAYGAPQGFGTDAVMFGTPREGDRAGITALPNVGEGTDPAFPTVIQVNDALHISFWLYLSSGSSAAPVIDANFNHNNFAQRITFDPIANGYNRVGEWMYVDATADDATWMVRQGGPIENLDLASEWFWPDLVEAHTVGGGGQFDYGLPFLQYEPEASAIDGITVTNHFLVPSFEEPIWSVTTDFELAPTHGRPLLDDCKNDGWRNHPAGTFRNQGACIAALVANR
jgi:hypothetical protein